MGGYPAVCALTGSAGVIRQDGSLSSYSVVIIVCDYIYSRLFNECPGELGMQPKFQYPRRSRFAPQCEDYMKYFYGRNIYSIAYNVNLDGFVKSPDAALRCILRRCGVP